MYSVKYYLKEQKCGLDNNFYFWGSKAYFSNHHTNIIISVLLAKLLKVLAIVFVLLPSTMF